MRIALTVADTRVLEAEMAEGDRRPGTVFGGVQVLANIKKEPVEVWDSHGEFVDTVEPEEE